MQEDHAASGWVGWGAPALCYALLLGLLYFPQLTGARTLFAGDIHQHYLPWEHFVATELQRGQLPTWDPGFYMGHPLFAEGQAAVLYPPTRLMYAFSGTDLAAHLRAFNWDVVLHWWIGGLGVCLLAQGLGLRLRSALLAGWCACLAGAWLVLPVNVPLLRVAIWMPWALLAMTLLLRTGLVRYAIVLTVIWSLALLAGGPQMVAMLWLAALVYFAGSVAELRENPRGGLALGLLFASPVIACSLAAVQLLPTFFLYRESAIAAATGAEALSFSASWLQLTAFLLPSTWAMRLPPEHPLPSYYPLGLYCTALSGALSTMAYFLGIAPLRLKVLLVVLLLFALGANTPVYPALLQVLPFLEVFRAPDRFLALAVVPLCVLAGFGLEGLLGAEESELPVRTALWRGYALLAVALPGAGFIVAGLVAAKWKPPDIGVAQSWWQLTNAAGPDLLGHAVLWAVLLVLSYPTIQRRLAPGFLIPLLLLGTASHQFVLRWQVPPLRTLPMAALAQPDELLTDLHAVIEENPQMWGRIYTVAPFALGAALFPEYRAADDTGTERTDILSWYHGAGPLESQARLIRQLHPNTANLYGFDYAGGIASLYTARMDAFLTQLNDTQLAQMLSQGSRPRAATLIDLAGIAYLIMDRPPPPGVFGTTPAEGFTIARNNRQQLPDGTWTGARPLVWVHRPTLIHPETQANLESIIELRNDPAHVLVLDRAKSEQRFAEVVTREPQASWVWQSSSHLVANVETTEESWLIFNQQWMPGWRARIDGRPEPVHRVWGIQLAVPLREPGKHTVEFQYVQPGYWAGLQISLATLVGLIALGAWVVIRQRQGGGSMALALRDAEDDEE